MKNEEWKELDDFPDYRVSDMGRVQSRLSNDGWKDIGAMNDGYLRVSLHNGKIRKQMQVHRLIMQAFVGHSMLTVNHKNGIKTDNRLENLEYCTLQENLKHAIDNKLHGHCETHGGRKLTAEQVREIIRDYRYTSYGKTNAKVLAKKYGVSQVTITNIVSRKNWKLLPEIARLRK